ncbi:MAG: MmcQ/YjbR family DNA-binding protein [Phycisphaerales bacterium]|nr:MmcQ/YjbR family DNA-binding protein [Phycisphaerales bacterium]MCB9841248.1 MmcQ/YjbR family DNA-binding protein [Phycisphaeraceae bacterium]
MPAKTDSPLEAMITAAAALPGADIGTSCTQTSFKVGGKAFLYVGQQGGRFKAMFRLRGSLPEAQTMGQDAPEDVQVGTTGWVTARFSGTKPFPARTWKKWLKESYTLAASK